jgi:hypothetical protein
VNANKLSGGSQGEEQRGLLRVVFYLVGGLLAALGVVVIMRWAGADRDMQRIAAFVLVIGALLLLLRSNPAAAQDPFAAVVTLVGLGVASVGALSFIGSIETPAPPGCLNTDGPIRATVKAEYAVIGSKADLASDPKGLVVRGCQLKFTGYCIGAVHQDEFDPRVPDARWLILPDGRGLIEAGSMAGTIPRDADPSKCPGGVRAPTKIVFSKAVIDEKTERVLLQAVAPRAAMIGFALKRRDGQWQRIGWDPTAEGGGPETLYLPARASVGTTVAATACIALRRPAPAPTKQLSLAGPGRSGTLLKFHVLQPVGSDPREVACKAGILPPTQ